MPKKTSKSESKRLEQQKPARTKSAESKIKNNAKKKFGHPVYMDKKDFIAITTNFIELHKTQLEHISNTISYYIAERANGLKALKQLNKILKLEKNEDILNGYLHLIDYYQKDVAISNAHIKNYRAQHALELKGLTATQKELDEIK